MALAVERIKAPFDQVSATSGLLKKLSLKASEPSRMNLTSPEAQLVSGVLDRCIDTMMMLTLLPSEPVQPEGFYLGLKEDLYLALSEHLHLMESYRTLGSRDDVNVNAHGEYQAAAKKAVQNSLRNVFRILKNRPDAKTILEGATLKTEDKKGVCELVQGLKELRAVTLDRLMTTPVEERERRQGMKEAKQSHSNNMELVATLEKQIKAAIMEKDKEIVEKNKVIFQLTSSIKRMERTAEDFSKRMTEDAEKQNQSDKRNSEVKQEQLQQDIQLLRVQTNNLVGEHKKSEVALRKRKYQLETEIDTCIQKYDADMEKQQAALDEMTEMNEREEAELREMEEQFASVNLEYSQIMEERRVAQERKEAEERELRKRTQAAIVLQACWRGRCTRKALKEKGKKGKAKDKGKKGKGKKK